MYAEYVKNFDQAMTSLAKWKLKSPKLAAVIDNIQVRKLSHSKQILLQRIIKVKHQLREHQDNLRIFKLYTVRKKNTNSNIQKQEMRN